ncbi:amino acid ABC transporter substrate-binding protein [Alteromonas sp. A079]|uniref:amino acid ABC transporter substrate-binding protein n=1 Tax=Alteromonas sp. A079 TaxID=3410268 RepID=UPI003BA35891
MKRNITITVFLASVIAFCGVSGGVYAQNDNVTLPDASAHTVLRLPNVHPGRDNVFNYAKSLLEMALTVTEERYGTYEFVVSESELSQERQLRSLEHDLLDVTWSVTSIDREKQHLAIRIPIMAGLFGKRILLINESATAFNTPLTLSQLQQLRSVQGYDWPDTKILRHNNMGVLETTYRASFRIVAEGFADMYPRGIMEISKEENNKALSRNLVIEPNLVLSYPSPMFFFTGIDNTLLAERITEGLLILIKNGECQRHLFAQEVYKDSMNMIRGRAVIHLENPLLSEPSKQAMDTFLPHFTNKNNGLHDVKQQHHR